VMDNLLGNLDNLLDNLLSNLHIIFMKVLPRNFFFGCTVIIDCHPRKNVYINRVFREPYVHRQTLAQCFDHHRGK